MPKLNREQVFNQQFVRCVKAHKCLYDHTSIEYRQRDLYEKAWEDVSKKCGESVMACRRRWRNLKTSTCRYIKQLSNAKLNDSSEHKEYYLYNDMKFVVPFLKTKGEMDDTADESIILESNSKTVKAEKSSKRPKKKVKYEEYELVTAEEGEFIIQQSTGDGHDSGEIDETNIIRIEHDQDLINIDEVKGASGPESETEDVDIGETTSHVVQVEKESPKQTFTLTTVTEPNPPSEQMSTDELFLKSLLPDITGMTKDQKRKFKIRVLTLIDEILS
uniref:CSON015056 protein n=1 Tax=Culicoides sonorensis TaxID=179676 RepID=A0A336LRG4_CULSO